MKEQNINQANLIEFLNLTYDITVSSLELIPIGEDSIFFKATTDIGSLGVKIQAAINQHALKAQEILLDNSCTFVPRFHKTQSGSMYSEFEKYFVTVQTFIESSRLLSWNEQVDDEFLVKLGSILRTLHNINTDGIENDLQHESYTFNNFEAAEETINTFRDWDFKSPIIDETKKFIKDSELIQKIMIGSHFPFDQLDHTRALSISHGDLHFANILESEEKELFLIDWDYAMLTLPERDLSYFSDDQIKVLAKGYGADIQNNNLEIQYYRYDLMYRAVWFWLDNAMKSKNKEGMASYLHSFQEIFADNQFNGRSV